MVNYAFKMIIFDHRQLRFQNNLLFNIFIAYAGHYHQMT